MGIGVALLVEIQPMDQHVGGSNCGTANVFKKNSICLQQN
jgi:hypothetical protein